MARRFTVDDWQQKLNALNQPLVIVGKTKVEKKEIFTILCYKCGLTFEADRKALCTACNLREKGKYQVNWCPICNGKRLVKGFNDVATLRSDLVKYFVNQEDAHENTINSHVKALLRCPECGKEKNKDIWNLCQRGFYCDYCDDKVSLGNKIIRNLILQLPVDEYAIEYLDTWTQNRRYDCYFSYQGIKYLIEIDGLQHIKNTNWATEEQQRTNDALKTELADKNGFKLIRIKAYKSDFDYIKENILNSELAIIFDLSYINWDSIYEQTITSLNVEMAKYYKEHEDMMLNDIAKHFHVSEPTLRKALKKLTKVGLCDYSKEKSYENAIPHIKRIRAMNRKVV